MNKRISENICEYFISLARKEKKIEIIRQILAENEDFEPYAAFKRIDRENKQFINSYDIQNFLSENGIQHSEKDCNLGVIQVYDLDSDRKLDFTE